MGGGPSEGEGEGVGVGRARKGGGEGRGRAGGADLVFHLTRTVSLNPKPYTEPLPA